MNSVKSKSRLIVFRILCVTLLILMHIEVFPAQNIIKHRIVRIKAKVDGKFQSGTGFFWGNDRHILTAYHVIHGASQIEIFYEKDSYEDISLVSFSKSYDMALLRIDDAKFRNKQIGELPEIYPDTSSYESAENIMIFGYPWGWSCLHRLIGYLPEDSETKSMTIRTKDQHDIFNEEIDVIKLLVPSYSGLSGGPVIQRNRIIGIFDGSVGEGSQLGWAIPIRFAKDTEKTKIVNWKVNSKTKNNWGKFELVKPEFYKSLIFQNIQPETDFKFQMSALFDVNLRDYNFNLNLNFDNYQRKISYGFEVGLINFNYEHSYEVLQGYEKKVINENNLDFYFNLFVSKRYYQIASKPYFGVSLGFITSGFPINIQFKTGMKFFSSFNLELRCLYFRSNEIQIEFKNYGNSEIISNQVNNFKILIGLSVDLSNVFKKGK